jgi:cyanophycinase-like exopeptidase
MAASVYTHIRSNVIEEGSPMPGSKQGTVVLMGSGEMMAVMVETHKYAMSLVDGALRAAFIDTPAGFQLNADLLSEKAIEFFRDHLNTPLDIISFKAAEGVSAEQKKQLITQLYEASYIFAGPGSPTYALRNWQHTPVGDAMVETLQQGGCLTFASAAALTLGKWTIPVYEVYKVGDSPQWVEGLNVFSHHKLDLAIVPHWNNTSGGDHDTRFCFMGEPRWKVLEEMLPPSTVVLGVDENTACVIRLGAGVCEVRGLGLVTVRRAGSEQTFAKGESFSLDLLRPVEDGEHRQTAGAPPGSPAASTWDQIRAKRDALMATQNPPLAEVAAYIYDLMAEMSTARDRADWETMTQAEDAVRAALVEVIARMGSSTGNVDELIGPYIELLLELRMNFRSAKQWDQADLIRQRLTTLGIILEDSPQGTTWRQGQ